MSNKLPLPSPAPVGAEIKAVTAAHGRRAVTLDIAGDVAGMTRKPLRLTMLEDARRQLEEHARALGCDAAALAEFLFRQRVEREG